MWKGGQMTLSFRKVSDHRPLWAVLFAAMAIAVFPCTSLALHPGQWTGDIGGTGTGSQVQTTHEDFDPFKGPFTVTVTNTGSAPWGDFHFGIFDPMGGQDISNVDFLDASMGGVDPTSSQAGLTWVINNVVVGATIDLYFCSDPVMPGETATFVVYTANPDHLSFFGVLFYPTPVPPNGACCHPDGSCTLVCVHDCLLPNVWHGEWTVCDPNPCPQPPGACCDPSNGQCFYVTEANCPVGFIWHGGYTCATFDCPVPPPTGACCDTATGACTITTELACAFTWLGANVPCNTTTCPVPPPKGACCNPATGECTYVEAAGCPQGWTWMLGVLCTPNNPCPPPPPMGACCDPLGGCTLTTEAACALPSVWYGTMDCTPNDCPPPVPVNNTTWGNIKATYR
jgi:hypothetical protein